MSLYDNTDNYSIMNGNLVSLRSQIIQNVKKYFSTFGYKEIYTPAFQPYDLYVHMNGTVNQQEMIKTIDNTGNVLVLRPDITIPLTQQIVGQQNKAEQDLRYFYILDVFRQAGAAKESQENTQIGVEYFGNDTPEADAEVIALGFQLLKQFIPSKMKAELGHAGFFKELAKELDLSQSELLELKRYIQAKNVPEIEHFIKKLNINDQLSKLVTALPFLYGKPGEVINQALQLPLTPAMREILSNMSDICDNLAAYDLRDSIAIDLSLINHMDYYSDLIFQGFIEQVGKPVLMGGRYNSLANQFGGDIPAVGFACDLDLLISQTDLQSADFEKPLDAVILYKKEAMKQAMALAAELRNANLQIITYPADTDLNTIPAAAYTIRNENDTYQLNGSDDVISFNNEEDLITFLQKERS